jgi:hypothetical protein
MGGKLCAKYLRFIWDAVQEFACMDGEIQRKITQRIRVEIRTFNLTLWSWVPLERPQVVQPLGSFPAVYGTRKFITEFTRALHLYFLNFFKKTFNLWKKKEVDTHLPTKINIDFAEKWRSLGRYSSFVD